MESHFVIKVLILSLYCIDVLYVTAAGTCYLWLLNTRVSTNIKSELLGFYYRNGTVNNMPRYLKIHSFGTATYIEVIHDTHKWIVQDGTRTTHARSTPTALDLVEEELSAPWQIWTTGSGWGVPVPMWFECYSRDLFTAVYSVKINVFPEQSPSQIPVIMIETSLESCLSGRVNGETCIGVTWKPYSKMCGCFVPSSDVCTAQLNPSQQPPGADEIAVYIDKARCRPEGLRCTNPDCDMCIIASDHTFCGCGPGRRIITGTLSQCEDTEECQEDYDCHAHQSCTPNGQCHISCNHGFHYLTPTNACKSRCTVTTDGKNVLQTAPVEVEVGETVSFKCKDGHTLMEGNLTRTCRLDFTWAGNPPVCSETTTAAEELSTPVTSSSDGTSTNDSPFSKGITTPRIGKVEQQRDLGKCAAVGIGAGIGTFAVLMVVFVLIMLFLRRQKRMNKAAKHQAHVAELRPKPRIPESTYEMYKPEDTASSQSDYAELQAITR